MNQSVMNLDNILAGDTPKKEESNHRALAGGLLHHKMAFEGSGVSMSSESYLSTLAQVHSYLKQGKFVEASSVTQEFILKIDFEQHQMSQLDAEMNLLLN